MALRVGDIGVNIDFDTLENITDETALNLLMRHVDTGRTKNFIGTLQGTQKVRYVTANADDIEYHGDWHVQAHVVQPGKDRKSVVATLVVQEAIG